MFDDRAEEDGLSEEFRADWQSRAADWARGSVAMSQALLDLPDEAFEAYLQKSPKEIWADLDGYLQTRLHGTQAPFVGQAGWSNFERFCRVASLPECLSQLCQGRSEEGTPEGFELRRFEFVAHKILSGMKSGLSPEGLRFGEAVCRSGLADAKALAYYCPEAFELFLWDDNPLLLALAEGFSRLERFGGEEAERGFFLLAQKAPWSYDLSVAGAREHIRNFDVLMNAGCPFPLPAQMEFFIAFDLEGGEGEGLRAQKAREWMIDSGRISSEGAREILQAGQTTAGWAIAMLEAKALEGLAPSSRGRDMRI